MVSSGRWGALELAAAGALWGSVRDFFGEKGLEREKQKEEMLLVES